MAALTSELRKQLEKKIRFARRVAEPGARKALEALAVDRAEPHASMLPDERALRTRLRAHGRQLGDRRDRETRTQEIERLAHEVAYEHWHRMLFARFLAENHLLIEPDSGVAISMAECEELARGRGEDRWEFAGRAAARMLPRIFRPDDPVLQVELAPETRQALERLLADLPTAVFTADDSLGWTYQFWQAERKEEVNESGVKIGADELPAVTQLFTEHYMVQFLFHNTIGAWRAGKILAERPELAVSAPSEEELRHAVRLESEGGYDFSYLRFVREPRDGDEEGKPSGPWRPAAGSFEGWPRRAAELRVLDPCCGSGHFLVEGLELLVRLRMEEESLPLDEALRAVIAENLFGLEIDPRCTQIAAFNLALEAWKLTRRSIDLPPMQIACSGLAMGSTKKEWLELAGHDVRLRGGMERLYELFAKAPELGSLIDPRVLKRDVRTEDFFIAEFPDLKPLLAAALERERSGWGDEDRQERAVAARDMAAAAKLLGCRYTLVITNVPYLGRRNQTNTLKAFADEHHTEAKADLATMFVARGFRWLGATGTQALVTPQNWLFLSSYGSLRRKLLSLKTLNAVALLGSNAFQVMNWWAATTAMVIWSSSNPERDARLLGFNVGADKSIISKSRYLSGKGDRSVVARDGFASREMVGPLHLHQLSQLKNPDSRIVIDLYAGGELLAKVADAFHGLTTGDSERMQLCYWEIRRIVDPWRRFCGPTDDTILFGGLEHLLRWDDGKGAIDELLGARKDGQRAWGRAGVLVRQMRHLPSTLYGGDPFDINTAVLVPRTESDLAAVWCFVASDEFPKAVRCVDQKLNVTSATLVKVPFNSSHWRKVAAEKYPNGLPEPQSDDPRQWLFHGHPAKSEPGAMVQVAVARLLGYRWPPEDDADMRLSAEARAWAQSSRELDRFADKDGIVCLSALRGELGAADRLSRLLAAALGSEWSSAKERELLAAAAEAGTPPSSLDEWLRDRFFEEHCRLFHQRPFIWHVWDGRKDGFHALVNYHRLAGPGGEGRRTLEALAYSYLGDWIVRQKAEQRDGKGGADARVAAALDLQAQLVRILAGEPPCDLFVRWKALHRQPIGWEPDLDDGVRLNIRPFLRAELRTGGRKGAGILRWKPNISWRKDRGREPQSIRPRDEYPWFWSCPGDGTVAERTDFAGGPAFDGNRWNDLHYTNAAKRAARENARSRGAA